MKKRILSIFLVAMALFVLAACKKTVYKVEFDTDGGNTIAAVEVKKGDKVAKPADPTKAGFEFVEWQLDGAKYDFDAKVTKAITLKAIWEEEVVIVKFNVTFDADGGSEVDSLSVVEGEKAGKPEDPKKTGYTFVQWKLGDEAYDFDAAVTEDITLKAEWKINEFTVKFDTDEGSTAPADAVVEYNKKVAKPNDPTKAGYKFVEWRLEEKQSDGKFKYSKYDFDKPVTKDMKLVAHWGFEVKFETSGGSSVLTQLVVEGENATKPADPSLYGFVFVEWRLTGETEAFEFNAVEIEEDITLNAMWGFEVTFDQGVAGAQAVVRVVNGETVEALEVTRDGYNFLGWHFGDDEYDFNIAITEPITLVAKWEEDEDYTALAALELPLKTHKDLTLPTADGMTWTSSNTDIIAVNGKVTRPEKDGFHAVKLTAKKGDLEREFWINVLAKDVDEDATYSAAFSEIMTLNPLMSTGSADSDVYSYLVDYLFGSDYDWEDAMANGFADFPGDFSKIRSDRNPDGTVEIPSIKMKRNLAMAAAYPFSVNNGTDNAIPGSYGILLDQDAAKATLDNEWIIYLRDDLKFENGDKIDADVFEYSFKQYINPKLKNARANYLYDSDYINLVNAKNYFDQVSGITWADVGFEKLSDLSFKLTLASRQTQYHVMTYLGIINLVNPTQFERGFNANGTENVYGSVQVPLISYGQFTLKNTYMDTNKFEFERDDNNYAAWNYTFKNINGPIIKDQQQIINEFKAGNLDIAGVGGEFWNDYKDDPNLYVAPSNSFYRIAISLDRGKDATRASAPILVYDDFRRALYLATDRQDFADNVQPPSQGALGFLSNIHQVTEWASEAYAASDIFFDQLEDLGLNPDEGGYNLIEAKTLFDKARADAISDGKYTANEKIVVQFSYYDAGSNTRIANWVKSQYEKVFNEGEDTKIFEIELNSLSSAELNEQRDAGDFDLVFTGMSGATFQATFGMGYIFSPTFSTFLVGKGHNVPTLPVEVEIPNLFAIVSEKLPEDRTESEQYLYDALKDKDGKFEGTFDALFLLWNNVDEFAVDYEGQEEDLHLITAALEGALLKQMVAVPLFSSTSAGVLGPNVVRIPHAYSLFLGWGGMYYMYKVKAAN